MSRPSTRARLRRGLTLAVIALAVIALAAFSAPAMTEEALIRPFQPTPPDLGYVPDEFVVEFKRHIAHQLEALPSESGRARANLPQIQALLDRVSAARLAKQFVSARPQPLGGKYPDLTGYHLVKLLPGSNLASAMSEFAGHPDVDHVEPIGIHTVDLRPNDKRYIWTPLPQVAGWPDRQWQYLAEYGIDAEPAWDTETGDPNVVVGVLDTGVKYRHKDLGGANPPGPADNNTQGNVWVNPGEIPGNGVDDDANGFVDDVLGWDFVDDATNFAGATCEDADCGIVENDPNDGEGHGTHLAGTIAAIANNDDVQDAANPSARGMVGVAGGFSDGTATGAGNGCKVMAVRIGVRVRSQGRFGGVVTMSWAAQAMNYVAGLKDKGINVAAINCSWGSSNSGGIAAAVANLQSKDVLIVNAAGNGNTSVQPYLASLPNVVAVAATDSTGVGASFTNYGSWIELAAPGVAIISTTHGPTEPDTTVSLVGLSDGTSMAAPHVAAVAGLLESYNPSLTALQKRDLMVNNTSPFGAGNTKAMGPGILNANLALLAAAPPVGVGDPPLAARPGLRLRAQPNPARAGADLVVSAAAGARVTLRIVDASGRAVRSFAGTADGTGLIRLRWDGNTDAGRRAATGLYFVTATAGREHATHKLVVLD